MKELFCGVILTPLAEHDTKRVRLGSSPQRPRAAAAAAAAAASAAPDAGSCALDSDGEVDFYNSNAVPAPLARNSAGRVTFGMDSRLGTQQPQPHSVVCYIARTNAIPGKFDMKRAKELGVPAGPLCGMWWLWMIELGLLLGVTSVVLFILLFSCLCLISIVCVSVCCVLLCSYC